MSFPILVHPEQNFERLKELGVSLAAFLDTVRQRKDKTFTVRLRIIYQRFPKYYTTKINLNESEYLQIAKQNGKPKGQLKDTRIIIYKLLKKANDIITKMDYFSFENFEKAFFNKQGDWKFVFNAFKIHIESLKSNEQIGTASTYITAQNSFKLFSNKEKLSFDEITVDWLNRYENWMIHNNRSMTSVSMNTRCLRRLYNIAVIKSGAKKELYPFGKKDNGKYQPPEHNNIKKALHINDIRKIFEYKAKPDSSESYYRDLWIFSYLCNGMNMADIFKLKYSNIKDDNIIFIRTKTSTKRKLKPIVVSITENIKEIIEKWGNKTNNDDSYIFDLLTQNLTKEQEQKKIKQATKMCNKYMKLIAKKIGIDENISTYYARHSYASILKQSGESIEYISESLGHSNLTVTENYLNSFDHEKRKNAAKKLTEWDQ